MKKRRVVLRADASKHIGYGHFIRSLALAGYLKDDFDCVFASFNEDGAKGLMTDYQLDEVFKVCTPADVFGHNMESFNANFIEELQPSDIVVLDNYYYETEYQKRIKGKGCKLVCVDDMHQYHMVGDLVITACPLKREDFSLEPYTRFVGGIEWAFLREAFLSPGGDRKLPSQVKRIVMAMGGADAFCLTDKMIEVILFSVPGAQLDVICGDTANVSHQDSPDVKIHRRLSAEEIVRLFDAADLGVFPASTICIEAFSRKLQVVAGYYVDNQKEFYDYGVGHRYFSGIGNLMDDAVAIADRLGRTLRNKPPRPIAVDFRSQKSKIIELFKSL